MLGSKCDLKMHVRIRHLWYTIPYKSGDQKPPFSTTSQLDDNLKAYIFGMKHDKHNRLSELETTTGIVSYYIVSKYHELWSTNGLKLDLRFTHSM